MDWDWRLFLDYLDVIVRPVAVDTCICAGQAAVSGPLKQRMTHFVIVPACGHYDAPCSPHCCPASDTFVPH